MSESKERAQREFVGNVVVVVVDAATKGSLGKDGGRGLGKECILVGKPLFFV